ncbi:unnamed protein product [Cunninghamella blakesleeana]
MVKSFSTSLILAICFATLSLGDVCSPTEKANCDKFLDTAFTASYVLPSCTCHLESTSCVYDGKPCEDDLSPSCEAFCNRGADVEGDAGYICAGSYEEKERICYNLK